MCPDLSLFQHLANMIKIHRHARKLLLLATTLPLIKDKLGDAENSDSYRSIALSSVILKVFDKAVIALFSRILGRDEL